MVADEPRADPPRRPQPTSGCPSPQVSTSGSPGASVAVGQAAGVAEAAAEPVHDHRRRVQRDRPARAWPRRRPSSWSSAASSIGDIANDPSNPKISGTAVVRYGPKGKTQAKVVAAQVPELQAGQRQAGRTRRSSLALGEAYTTSPPRSRPPSPSPRRPHPPADAATYARQARSSVALRRLSLSK